MRILKGKLLELAERERLEHMAEIKGEMKKIEWGSQIRSYVFQPYTLVKDHRTGVEVGNIQSVIDGDLDVFINAFPAALTITSCVFAVMLVCQNVYHSTEMLNTACVLVTGWNYMAALKTVYAPLNTYRKTIIYGMQFIFFAAAVIFQKLLSLGSLDFGMIILVFILMTFAPVLIDVITVWLKGIYARSLDKENPGKFTAFIDKLRK